MLSIINSDTRTVYDLANRISKLVRTPIELAYCIYFLYIYIGFAILPGLAVYGVTYLIQR